MEWQALSSALLIALQSTLGNMDRRHQDRFDDNATDIRSLIHDRNAARDALLRNSTSRTRRERFSSKRATVQRRLRRIENNWLARKAAQIQSYANIDDTKNLYEALKGVYGPRWAEYLQNKVHVAEPGFLDDLPTLPTIPKLYDTPSFDEVEKAIISLKDNKAAGPDNISAEVIKHGGCALHRRLHDFILDCWSVKCLPQQLKNANIVLAYKQNHDRAECGNSRGISLLSVSGNLLAKIMLTHLLELVVDLVLPESQCGFRRDNATHALASSATAKPTFNVKEEFVVIRNGWTPKKKKKIIFNKITRKYNPWWNDHCQPEKENRNTRLSEHLTNYLQYLLTQ